MSRHGPRPRDILIVVLWSHLTDVCVAPQRCFGREKSRGRYRSHEHSSQGAVGYVRRIVTSLGAFCCNRPLTDPTRLARGRRERTDCVGTIPQNQLEGRGTNWVETSANWSEAPWTESWCVCDWRAYCEQVAPPHAHDPLCTRRSCRGDTVAHRSLEQR